MWSFQSEWTLFANITSNIKRIFFLISIHEFVPAESLETTNFAESPEVFGRSPWNFLDVVLTSIRNKRKMRRRFLIAQRGTIAQSYQYKNLEEYLKVTLDVYWNWKQYKKCRLEQGSVCHLARFTTFLRFCTFVWKSFSQ